ncbi:MAG: class B sortase, partial [Clostridia bacterium]|nr:class B sortase [Clostridia bacterium]
LPVVCTLDNDYYLKKNIYKEDSISGSIFLDYRNSGFDDKHTIVYGHNMKNDSMFGRLDEILKGKTRKQCRYSCFNKR